MESEARARVRSEGQAGWPGLRSLLDELSEGALLIDAGGRVLDANTSLCRILGRPREHCVRRRLADIVPATASGRVAHCLAVARGGRRVATEILLRGEHPRRLQLRLVPQARTRILGLVRDVTEARTLEREVQQRAGYQGALERVLDASASPDFLDRALRAIGECADVSHSYLFAMDDARRLMVCTHEWVAPGIEPFVGLEASYDDFPFWLAELRADRAIVACDIRRDLPEEVHEILSAQGILSLLVVPLRRDGALSGFLGLDVCAARREWLPLEAGMLRSLGRILTSIRTAAPPPRFPA
jgi:PAS domain S-box-containing protein